MTPELQQYQREWKREWRARNPGKNAAAQLAWRAKNLEHARATDRARYARDCEKRKTAVRSHGARLRDTPEKWLKTNLTFANSRARRAGIPFGVTTADVALPTHCPITLRELKYGCRRGDRDGPSLDRLIPNRGYVAGNVCVISYYANTLKRDCAAPEIFERLALYCRNTGYST